MPQVYEVRKANHPAADGNVHTLGTLNKETEKRFYYYTPHWTGCRFTYKESHDTKRFINKALAYRYAADVCDECVRKLRKKAGTLERLYIKNLRISREG